MIKLKKELFFSVLLVLLSSIVTSCNKQTVPPYGGNTTGYKKFQFSLYTDKDFSGEANTISFTLFIQNLQSQTLWDSSLAPMKIKDIPGITSKLIIEKAIAVNGNLILKAGFKYAIENVGYSRFYDTCHASETFKKIDFNFQ